MCYPETKKKIEIYKVNFLVELRSYRGEGYFWEYLDLYELRILMEVLVLKWESLKPKEQGFQHNDDHCWVSRA